MTVYNYPQLLGQIYNYVKKFELKHQTPCYLLDEYIKFPDQDINQSKQRILDFIQNQLLKKDLYKSIINFVLDEIQEMFIQIMNYVEDQKPDLQQIRAKEINYLCQIINDAYDQFGDLLNVVLDKLIDDKKKHNQSFTVYEMLKDIRKYIKNDFVTGILNKYVNKEDFYNQFYISKYLNNYLIDYLKEVINNKDMSQREKSKIDKLKEESNIEILLQKLNDIIRK